MERRRAVMLFTVFAIFCSEAVLGAPSITINDIGVSGDNDAFRIITHLSVNKYTCDNNVTISGKGVFDTFDLSCKGTNGLTSIGTEKYAIYRNPDEHLTFFTSTPNSLILIEDDKCINRNYETFYTTTIHTDNSMSQEECKKAMEDMEEAEKDWAKDFEEKRKTSTHEDNDFDELNNWNF